MTSLPAVIASPGAPPSVETLARLNALTDGGEVALVLPSQRQPHGRPHVIIRADSLWSSATIADTLSWFVRTGGEYLLWCLSPNIDLLPGGLKRLVSAARDAQASLVYSDYMACAGKTAADAHPLVDYQPGSLRDDFDFGHVLLLNGSMLRKIARHDRLLPSDLMFGGWYDLRLRIAESGPVVHLPEMTYSVVGDRAGSNRQSHFEYVDPRNRDYQMEMERIATDHLKRTGAFLQPALAPRVESDASFPVQASVVIPVRNRQKTVGDAVASALSQETSFDFNVIVVDNHSTDDTTSILSGLAKRHPRLVHNVPQRRDLGIGGCWNEAIFSARCGRYAVQLDSDDLYDGNDVLERIVKEFERTNAAMVIGSYTLVDFDLNPIPPGLIDHREWTDENGANNALRIAGLGAPRAFHVPTIRTIGFPNVSYGEDYAVALRVTRSYRLARIYDSLYLCRRWEDNTDHALPLEIANRHAMYKDRLRTLEIAARMQ